MTPLDALPYSSLFYYNILNSTGFGYLPYSFLSSYDSQSQFQRKPQVLINEDRNKQGRAYNPGRPLSMNERERILHLYENGHKISHIAKLIGVTHSCVSKIMTRYRRTGSMFPRSLSIGILSSKSTTLDDVEGRSECSTSTCSEEWNTFEILTSQ
ncbi:Helix-turn-helix domain of resolvase [Dictyocaulus viviparus]|uniref:Helix-turn-helix domain of resolvase n=1 Tax=Dictyocaulus viviparus TaxID=29172 RepID=A0A0D8XCB5_DICVI|nr:Helix-turn-helix domain of resolvase [Dictyocaulus viviparus]